MILKYQNFVYNLQNYSCRIRISILNTSKLLSDKLICLLKRVRKCIRIGLVGSFVPHHPSYPKTRFFDSKCILFLANWSFSASFNCISNFIYTNLSYNMRGYMTTKHFIAWSSILLTATTLESERIVISRPLVYFLFCKYDIYI